MAHYTTAIQAAPEPPRGRRQRHQPKYINVGRKALTIDHEQPTASRQTNTARAANRTIHLHKH